MSRAWRVASVVAAALLTRAAPVDAQDPPSGVRIGLTYGAGQRPRVLVMPIRGAGGDSIRAILARDLDLGDRAQVVTGDGPAPLTAPGRTAALDYALAAQLGLSAVVEGVLTSRGGVRLTVHDVAHGQAVEAREVTLPTPALGAAWRLAVHTAADAIEERLTGVRGIAATRVLFVRGRRVWQVDTDGHGAAPVSEDGALSPAWDPAGDRFAFSQFTEQGTRIVVRDADGEGRGVPGTGRGLHVTPAFSPDGRTLVWSRGDDDGADLVARTDGEDGTRLVTVGRGADNVSPSFAPDGQRLAFTSGRSGHPEVYIADEDGTNAELLTPFTFGDRAYRSNPAWSPDGRAIAFQSQVEGRFQVMLIGLRDRAVRQLTSDGGNEDPSWAPDGRHLVFTSTRGGGRDLWVLDTESGRSRQLTFGGDARMPAWGPRLPAARSATRDR